VLAVFAAGVAAGLGWGRACPACKPPPPRGLDMAPPSLEALHLTAEQERRAREIGDRHRPEIEAIRREVAPRLRAIHVQMQKEMEAFLTPEQRARQDEEQRGRGVGPHAGPPDGPPGSQPPPPL